MLRNRKILYLILALLMVSAVFISGGCGGGSSGGSYIIPPTSEEDSGDDGGGWIVPVIPESPDNGGGDNDGGSGGSENFSPYSFNGTWEIVEGKATPLASFISENDASYLSGYLKTFEIIVKQNTSDMYGGNASGFYTIILRGEDVIGHEASGYTEISVPFDDGFDPISTTFYYLPFSGGRDFKYEGDNILLETDEYFYEGEDSKLGYTLENKYTLLDYSTIKWTYLQENNTSPATQTTPINIELTLKRVK